MLTEIRYVMHKAPYVFPIVGGRTVKHLQGNIEALGVELSRDEIDELEAAAPFDYGFPFNVMRAARTRDVSGEGTAVDAFGNTMFLKLEEPALVQPIKPGDKLKASKSEFAVNVKGTEK